MLFMRTALIFLIGLIVVVFAVLVMRIDSSSDLQGSLNVTQLDDIAVTENSSPNDTDLITIPNTYNTEVEELVEDAPIEAPIVETFTAEQVVENERYTGKMKVEILLANPNGNSLHSHSVDLDASSLGLAILNIPSVDTRKQRYVRTIEIPQPMEIGEFELELLVSDGAFWNISQKQNINLWNVAPSIEEGSLLYISDDENDSNFTMSIPGINDANGMFDIVLVTLDVSSIPDVLTPSIDFEYDPTLREYMAKNISFSEETPPGDYAVILSVIDTQGDTVEVPLNIGIQ